MGDFPAVLRGLRRHANMTQPELAERLGVSRSAVSMYESGSREPNFATMALLSEIFRVDMNTLTGTEPALRPASDAEVKLALFGDGQADDALYGEVKAFARFLMNRRK